MFSFKGFNDVDYNLPDLPSEINNYNHFIILNYSDNYFILFGFNDTFEIFDEQNCLKYVADNGNNGGKFFLYPSDNSWTHDDIRSFSLFGYNIGERIVYSDNSLFSYKNEFLKEFNKDTHILIKHDLLLPDEPVFTQSSLLTEFETISMNSVLDEVVGVLPVLIIVLVSFLGIRKAIKFLFDLLRKS